MGLLKNKENPSSLTGKTITRICYLEPDRDHDNCHARYQIFFEFQDGTMCEFYTSDNWGLTAAGVIPSGEDSLEKQYQRGMNENMAGFLLGEVSADANSISEETLEQFSRIDEGQWLPRIKQACYDFAVKGLFVTGGQGLLVAGRIMERFYEDGDVCYETMYRILEAIELSIWQTVFYAPKKSAANKTLPACEWHFMFNITYAPDISGPINDEQTLEHAVAGWAEERGYKTPYCDDCYFLLSNPLGRPIPEKAVQELKQAMQKWSYDYPWQIEDICTWPKYSVADLEIS